MKKFEGIFTIIGVLVIVGMPLFLMFADFNASSSVLSDGYIRVLSYDDSITNTIDGNFEQTYSALDGTNFRDEVIYLYNDIEKEVSINDQIVSFNDEYIPLGITPLPEITETVNKQPEVIPIPIAEEVIEPEIEPIIDIEPVVEIEPVEIIEVKEEASSDEITDDLVMDEEIVIEDIVPEGVSELDELMPSGETFGDDIEDEIIEITEDIPEAASLGESEEIDSEEITEEESSSSAQSEESASPDEETFDDEEEEEILTEEELEVVIENPIPEAIVPIEESFEETLEDEIIIEDEVPEGLLGLDGLEVSTSDDGNIHEARYVSYSVDEFGNEIGSLVIFSY